jgi:hypothetical protein
MPLMWVDGDPLRTQAQTLAVAWNAAGRAQVGPFDTDLLTRYPSAFASFAKRARHAATAPRAGQYWLWRESLPQLLLLLVRDTPHGILRPRYVESALMLLARDYPLERLTTLAIAPLTDPHDPAAPLYHTLIETWLQPLPLRTVGYHYRAGVAGEADPSDTI